MNHACYRTNLARLEADALDLRHQRRWRCWSPRSGCWRPITAASGRTTSASSKDVESWTTQARISQARKRPVSTRSVADARATLGQGAAGSARAGELIDRFDDAVESDAKPAQEHQPDVDPSWTTPTRRWQPRRSRGSPPRCANSFVRRWTDMSSTQARFAKTQLASREEVPGRRPRRGPQRVRAGRGQRTAQDASWRSYQEQRQRRCATR